MATYIGIDLGGTQIRGGRIVDDALVAQTRRQTPRETKDEYAVIDAIKEVVETVTEGQPVEAIGIGVPGMVDRARGIVYHVMNIPHWEEKVELKKILEATYRIPVYIDNDANCFALGERYFGAGRNFEHFVGLTVGTGLGGGIIQQGRLLADANCGSGEFGMLPYKDQVLEYYASGSFFQNVYGVDGKEMYRRACDRDAEALQAYRELGKHLAEAVMMVVLTIDPQMIVFGGSVAEAHELYEVAMYAHLKTFAYSHSMERLQLFFSELEHPGILGAASLCY